MALNYSSIKFKKLNTCKKTMKKALITGITGQDGSYLAELLLSKGYEVHGIVRRSSSFNTGRIDHIHSSDEETPSKILLHYADLSDSSSLFKVINGVNPDEIYNLGAQSHVRISFDAPEYTGDIVGLGATRLLEVARSVNPKAKIYQASSSEMFGLVSETPQRETTPFHPRSPYGCAKVYAYWITRNYRESYNTFACNGILFNHESPRRGRNFVTRKITRGLCEIKEGLRDKISLGNLDAKRDWGFAGDYVEAMWLMLQQDKPGDYVIATGETHSVREFIEEAAKEVGFEIEWSGQGINEVGKDKNTGKTIIGIDSKYFRPAEVELLLGDPTKAKEILGWSPKTKFKDLVKMMMDSDKKMLKEKDERF